MALRPLTNCVLIAPTPYGSPHNDDPRNTIVLPDKYAVGPWDYAHQGTVVAVGPTVTLVTPHQHVVYGKWSFAKFEHDGHSYVIVRESDVLAVCDA